MTRTSTKTKRTPRRRPRIQIGAAPGSITPVSGGTRPVIEVMAYGPDGFDEQQPEDLRSIPSLQKRWPTVWIHIQGLGNADLIKSLGQLFSLHPLALEDVISRNQRPKVESYDDLLYVVAMALADGDGADFGQVNFFVGERFVLSLQEREFDWREPVKERIRAGRTPIRKRGANYLGYSLLDSMVDHYFPVIEQYSVRLEAMEGEVLAKPTQDDIARIHTLRNPILALRHHLAPLKSVVNTLSKDELPPITEGTRIYFRDLSDHITHLLENIDVDREAARSLIDLSLSISSTRMNEVMKVLTIIATIFMPLGFIAGVFGMNFDPAVSPFNMPELGWHFGYPYALLLMAGTVAWMLLLFRRKGWFGSGKK